MAKGKVRPSYIMSERFLIRWNPEGPWVLVAIDPDKRAIDTRSFFPNELATMSNWLKRFGADRNIYFTVNPVVRPLEKKPAREHIQSLSWLHVDLDPRSGEDLDNERARIWKLLVEPRSKGMPQPTVIINSGGGFQGFWKLNEPLPLDGTPEEFEEAKRYNKQVEILLGGDNCHNVDRIMRLPGTVNRPDRKKRAKGRKEALASMALWEKDAPTYDLSDFQKAPKVQGGARKSGGSLAGGHKVEVSGNVERFSSVSEIPELSVDNPKQAQCMVVIVQGLDPDDADKFGASRSEWLFFVCCEMVRAGCDDDTVFSVITDPDFKISDSIYTDSLGEPQKDWENYALRQIQRAREDAINPMLREFNDRHAVIGSIGSKGLCRILSEEMDPRTGRSRISYQSRGDFYMRYQDRFVLVPTMKTDGSPGADVKKPAAQWWLENTSRRYYDTVDFFPGGETPGSYNLWRGFAYESQPGSCDLYLGHILDNLCCRNQPLYDWLINWMAWTVQEPANAGQVAIVLRGEQGVGKGVFAHGFGRLWGRHYLHISDSKHLTGAFNGHLKDCVVLFADEAVAAADKTGEGKLKTLVTEDTMALESKGLDTESVPNFIHIIMASNNDWVIPAGPHERRFLVLDVSNDRRQDGGYFKAIAEEMANGGYEALLFFLLGRDISNFNPRAIPRTAGLSSQQEHSLSPEEEWWYNKLHDGQVFPGEDWPQFIYCSHALYDLREEVRMGPGRVRVSNIRLGKLLKAWTDRRVLKKQQKLEHPVSVMQEDGLMKEVTRPYIYELPSLDGARRAWEKAGYPSNWGMIETSSLPYEEEDLTDPESEEVFG